MRDNLLKELMDAMKSQDKELLSVLRMVKGAIQLEEISKKHQLTDEEFVSVISKQIKMRKESNIEFEKANRSDLIDQNNKEIEILNKYMPEQLSDDEIIKIVDCAFDEIKPSSQSDMGKIMGFVTPKLKGKADMSLVSKMIKERLANL